LDNQDDLAAGMQNLFAQVENEDEVRFFSYAVSKNFVAWYAEQLAINLGARGIRVLSVAPGVIDTPMVQSEADSGTAETTMGAVLGRMGSPEELGSLLAFLATGPATYITGTNILCDGGFVANLKASSQG
jgi:NAD(P)-dependent dehydrogenase (short-subunit alcohol dehydrogenase family)